MQKSGSGQSSFIFMKCSLWPHKLSMCYHLAQTASCLPKIHSPVHKHYRLYFPDFLATRSGQRNINGNCWVSFWESSLKLVGCLFLPWRFPPSSWLEYGPDSWRAPSHHEGLWDGSRMRTVVAQKHRRSPSSSWLCSCHATSLQTSFTTEEINLENFKAPASWLFNFMQQNPIRIDLIILISTPWSRHTQCSPNSLCSSTFLSLPCS